MKGVLKGSLWGLVLGGSGLGFASLVSEHPEFAKGPPAPQLTVPAFDVAAADETLDLQSNADETPLFVPVAPLDVTPDQNVTAPTVSTAPAALPQTADVAAGITAPETALTTEVATITDAPDLSRVETALAAPTIVEDTSPIVDTTPAAALPEPAAAEPAEENIAQNEEQADPDILVIEVPDTPVVEESDAPLIVITEPQAEDSTDLATATVELAPENDETTEQDIIVIEVPEAPVADEAAPLIIITDAEEENPADDVPEALADETALIVIEVPDAPAVEPVVTEVAPVIVAPAPIEQDEPVVITEVLPQTMNRVRINRPTETATETETPPPADVGEELPALARYAVPFERVDDAALISIILVDDGQMPDGPGALADLGFVPTVAVNALSSASTERAAAYRDAGVEVAMQAQLPDGAQPTDVEVAFEAARGLVSEVTMLFSDGTGAMQNRAVTAQVMQILAADGYGFVAVQRGLSNAARAAELADVPAAIVLRDIDGAGEDARAIGRALDQAAFRARQSGSAVLLGRMAPDTLAALKTWAADLDQDTLAIAPVSAILLNEE